MIKYRFLKFLTTEVACHRRRLLNTSVARELPNVGKKTTKKVPKAVRKAMVDDYVKKYRALNAGKFPCVKDTIDQVGGSFYIIKAILQELEYNSKLSAPVTEAVDCATALDKIVEPEDLSEDSIHCVTKIDNDKSDKKLMEKTADDRILMESEKDNSQFCAKPSFPSDTLGGDVETFGDDKIKSSSSSKTDGISRLTVPDPESTNKQDDDSILPAVGVVDEVKGKQTAKAEQISQDEGTLWGNMKSVARKFINIWRT